MKWSSISGTTAADRTLLLMHAWIDYADSTSNLAASQAGASLIPPYLQVQDDQGKWVDRVGTDGVSCRFAKDDDRGPLGQVPFSQSPGSAS